MGKSLLTVLSSPFLFFQVRIDTCTLLMYLWFSQNQRLGHSEALRAVNLRRFLALRLLLGCVKKSNLFNSTLNATISWLENGVS